MTHMPTPQSVVDLLKTDPGNRLFIDYAESLRLQGELPEALAICLAGLNANPRLHDGRLLLGRIFFELGYPLFAAREIRELLAVFPDNAALTSLLLRLHPGAEISAYGPPKIVKTIVEQDFDIATLERLGQPKD